MPRIEIELTSSRPDGSWTWRAAGARQPKGTLDGSLLHAGAKVGEVLRAEVDVDIEGMTVTSVTAPKGKRAETDRLEIIGPPNRDQPGVTADRVTRDPREGGRGRDRGERGDRGDRTDRPSRDDRGRGPRADRGDRSDRGARGDRPERPGGERGARGERPAGAGGPPRREARPGGGPGTGPGRPGATPRPHPGGERGERPRPSRERSARPPASPPTPRPRPKRLHPGRARRDAALASLAPEERPIAEQVLRGGVPAVRQAIEEQNTAARAAGAPEIRAEPLIAIAERLLPAMRAAEWQDRAEAAIAAGADVALRDLRALVAGSDAAGRDETGRDLAVKLRQTLEERSTAERDAWLAEIVEALDAGRVVRALRSSGRPPEPGVRFPADLAERLGSAAGEAMGPDVAPDRWAAVLEAVTLSPVRRTVRPRGLPAEAPADFLAAARVAAEKVPGLGLLVGVPAGPPPAIGARRPAPAPRVPPPPTAAPRPAPPAEPRDAPPDAPTLATTTEPEAATAPAQLAPEPESAVAGPEAAFATAPVAVEPQPAPAEPERAVPEPEVAAVEPGPGAPARAMEAEADTAAAGEPESAAARTSGDDGDNAVLVEELR